MAIRRILDLSTGHITTGDDRLLKAGRIPKDGTGVEMLEIYPMVPGYLLHFLCPTYDGHLEGLGTTLAEYGYSWSFAHVLDCAYQSGCDFIRLDPDGEVIGSLPLNEWQDRDSG